VLFPNKNKPKKDITIIHSVADLLGVNSISGRILENAAAGICGMVLASWKPDVKKKRIATDMIAKMIGSD
jgi:uncharacterized protein (UPF0261 family)